MQNKLKNTEHGYPIYKRKTKGKISSKLVTIGTVTALLFAPLSQTALALPFKMGDSDAKVQEAETMLHRIGYYVQVDSKFDRFTHRAVSLFQAKNGLPSTGILDHATYNRLKDSVNELNSRIGQAVPTKQEEPSVNEVQPAPQQQEPSTGTLNQPADKNSATPSQPKAGILLKTGDSGVLVQEIERMLSRLGYYVQENGKYDRFTVRAVSKFQSKQQIPSTGVVDEATYNLLKKEIEKLNNRIGQAVPVKKESPAPTQPATPQVNQPVPTTPQVNQAVPTTPEVSNQPVQVPEVSVDFPVSAEEKRMIELVNKERVERGLPPLQVDERLMNLARLKAKDMIENNYFSHHSPTYGSPFEMMRNAGISYQRAGENIAGNMAVEMAHTALMNSSGHRANILSSNYDHIGIGIIPGSRYGNIYVQMFIKK